MMQPSQALKWALLSLCGFTGSGIGTGIGSVCVCVRDPRDEKTEEEKMKIEEH
jgi:hypothetical protein